MKIGIIGTGQIGGTLARRFTAIGHEVFIANSRGPDTLAELAKETGATAVPVFQAARSGDVVVITIPEKNILKLPAGLFDGVADIVGWMGYADIVPHIEDMRFLLHFRWRADLSIWLR
jgi:predicted dinucleotide-binding enzyme